MLRLVLLLKVGKINLVLPPTDSHGAATFLDSARQLLGGVSILKIDYDFWPFLYGIFSLSLWSLLNTTNFPESNILGQK